MDISKKWTNLFLFVSLLFLFIVGTNTQTEAKKSMFEVPVECQKLIKSGEYSQAQKLLRQKAEEADLSPEEKRQLLFEAERLDRIRIDFRITPEQMLKTLQEEIPDADYSDMERWREAGVLEGKVIDGKLWYFRAADRNLLRLSEEAKKRKKPEVDAGYDDRQIRIEDYMARIIEASQNSDDRWVSPWTYKVHYTLSVNPDEVPAGETVRCWLAFPRDIPPQQSGINLISACPENAVVAPNKAVQRTVYLEQPARAGKATVFDVTYELTVYAQYEEIEPEKVERYDKSSALYKEYTAENPPHLVWTPELKKMAKEIVGQEPNPYLKAKKIFDWIDSNIRYTSALEYSTIPNISQYCAVEGRGDCGIQALLFIALCRLSGVPARWQSGWSLIPGRVNMHDWTRFYVEPYGWLPADPSRGLRPVKDEKVRWFNFGNMDAFRLVANDGYGAELYPPKKHFRSEPVDFQRGEVEWDGGNLYFPQWDWDIEVEFLKKGEE